MQRSNIRAWYRLLSTITPLVAAAACGELTNPRQSSLSASALTGAFSTVPVGYGDLTSSFVGTAASGVPAAGLWLGGGRENGLSRSSLMGGGIQGAFVGDGGGFGRGLAGPFGGGLSCTSTFNASTGRVVCEAVTQNGLTINRSAQYKDAAGAVQQVVRRSDHEQRERSKRRHGDGDVHGVRGRIRSQSRTQRGGNERAGEMGAGPAGSC